MNRKSQRGVALVITLIMLSIVLIMAVLFLGISRRERASVTGNIELTVARNAADHGQSRALAEMIARITTFNSPFAYGMAVSTNLINPNGFQPGVSSFTNVSYTYLNGQPLSGNADIRLNQANLFYDPRPPVFVVNNNNVTEFRYYLDLNRNGKFDTNGFQTIISTDGQTTKQSGFFWGDPEWIGILEHPDQPHSGSNRFIGRYAFLVVPAGRTLDINYIHNNARETGTGPNYSVGYSRNQGVGSWEINLAAFFRDLNTNYWPGDPVGYHYNPNLAPSGSGLAFLDALSVLTNRSLGNFRTLNTVGDLFPAGRIFQNDRIDEYGDDRPPTGLNLVVEGGPTSNDSTNRPWFGSENTNGYTRIDELFDPRKSWRFFVTRLTNALANPGTYNQNTFYRLAAQLGTDSLPANRGKLNLNYDNVNNIDPNVPGFIDPSLTTSLVPWTPIRFFTNAADLMLRSQSSSILSQYGNTNLTLSVTNIPIYPTNFYFASVHRLLQLAANIQDASTNRFPLAAGTNSLYAPTVFRPLFGRRGTLIYISGFEEVISTNALRDPWVDLTVPALAFSRISESNPTNRVNVYGIPYVVGAKKGFPNFNEFLVQTSVQVTRRMEVVRNRREDRPVFHQSYELGITNYLAMEAWNSYTQAFPRALQMIVTNSTWLSLSNANPGAIWLTNKSILTANSLTLPPDNWVGQEFRVPMSNSVVVVPNAEFSFSNPLGLRALQENLSFDHSRGFPVPDWKLNITNRLQFILVDIQSGRIVDFVNLDRMIGGMDIMREVVGRTNAFGDAGLNPGSFWFTNRVVGVSDPMTWGMTNQIFVSTNDVLAKSEWTSFTDDPISGKDKEDGIDNLRKILDRPALYHPEDTNVTWGTVQVPFTPTRKLDQSLSWQVNDPLVHYHIEDISDTYSSVTNIQVLTSSQPSVPNNIGQINRRYRPWGGSLQSTPGSGPFDYNLAVKDPLITQSDDWDFPTNKFPNIGWLGRVHRGTPWQTVYLKSQVQKLLDVDGWVTWAGRADTHPTNDWHLLSLFTTAPNDAAARGLLSVNQTNIAAWSAVLSGVPVISNGLANLANLFIEPASPQLYRIVNDINTARWLVPGTTNLDTSRAFPDLGSVLRSPALTVASPFLNTTVGGAQKFPIINDALYERIPQQILSLLKDDEPYVVIYAFGQSLKPASDSVVTAPGPYRGLCTNYQVTAEVATKTAVRIERQPNSPNIYKAVVESYSILPTD
jgi:hypothetical protein